MTCATDAVAPLGRFVKQSTEVLDYPVSFEKWFVGRSDTAASHTVTAEAGLTVASSSRSGNVVTAVLSGGTVGATYKVTVRLTTSNNIVREADFYVSIRDV